MRTDIRAVVACALTAAALSACSHSRPTGGGPEVPLLGPTPVSQEVVSEAPPAGATFGVYGAAAIAFPPRNEPFDFRQQLEAKYRDGLRRPATSTFVDLEGDIVWTQEYLRYRVNACDHNTATAKVMAQIDGFGIQPVCGEASSGQVLFPPRNEPFNFRQQLEAKYRDGLRRSPTSTFVDLEGDIVWTQEYLRYRVNFCDHPTAVSKVFAQIDGRGIQPDCSPNSPLNLNGVWTGTSTYVNAPFQVTLVQIGTAVTGQYTDRHDAGSVRGTFNNPPAVSLNVDFGDTGILLDGAAVDSRTITGVIRVAVLSGGPFPFTMTR